MSVAQMMQDEADRAAAEAANKSTIYAKFHNSVGNSKYTFKDGHEAYFVGGVFYTQDPTEYAELMAEIRARHPLIHQVAGEEAVDLKEVDPVRQIEERAIAAYKAQVEAANKGDKDQGSTDPNEKFTGIGTTDTVGAASAGSTSGAPGVVAASAVAGTANVGTAALLAKVAAAKTAAKA